MKFSVENFSNNNPLRSDPPHWKFSISQLCSGKQEEFTCNFFLDVTRGKIVRNSIGGLVFGVGYIFF